MLLACNDCDVLFRGSNSEGFGCPNCGSHNNDRVRKTDEVTQEQKGATQEYVFGLTRHETVEHAMASVSQAGLQVAQNPPQRALLQMLESSIQSVMSAIACSVYARMIGEDPWMLAFEGDERAHLMEDMAQDFSDMGYDVTFSWSDDSPYAEGKVVPKKEVVQRELEAFREENPSGPMHELLADHICQGGGKTLQLLALQPEGVPPEGRATVAKTVHELLSHRGQILLALGADVYHGLAEILEEFQVPHYRDIEEFDDEKIHYIIPEKDGEYLERIRQALSASRPSAN